MAYFNSFHTKKKRIRSKLAEDILGQPTYFIFLVVTEKYVKISFSTQVIELPIL